MPEIRHGEPTSETVTSARHDTDAGVVEKLKALRTMCEASGQPFYVEILDEVLARLTNPAEPSADKVIEYCDLLEDAVFGSQDSRLFRENLEGLRFYATHGRTPDFDELRVAMRGGA